jgi:hypothetical protein
MGLVQVLSFLVVIHRNYVDLRGLQIHFENLDLVAGFPSEGVDQLMLQYYHCDQ